MYDALILAGGFGTRLRPLTFSCPKPFLPFCNLPILEHQIRSLLAIGQVKRIVLAISDDFLYLPLIKKFASQCEKRLSIEIFLSIESFPLDTGGPLGLAADLLTTESFIVFNGDIITHFPLQKMLSFHQSHGREGTMATYKVPNPSAYGVVLTENQKVQSFVEKPSEFVSDQINAGIYIFSRSILKRIQKKRVSLEREIFPKMARDSELMAFKMSEKNDFWMDLGRPISFVNGTREYVKHLIKKKELYFDVRSASAEIDETATVDTFSVIGRNCVIESGATVTNSTLFDHTIVKSGAKVENSVIGGNCVIESKAVVRSFCVLDQCVVVAAGSVIENVKVCSHRRVAGELKDQVVL